MKVFQINLHEEDQSGQSLQGRHFRLAAAKSVQFSEPDAGLGNARTAALAGGGLVGVRAPMHEAEDPVVRPYWPVDDIEASVAAVVEAGGEVAHPPMEIPGRGTFAINIQGGIHYGLWQG